MKTRKIKHETIPSNKLSPKREEEINTVTTPEFNKLQELAKSPSVVGILEFLTGAGAVAFDKPSNFILSGGRLTQALFKGKFQQQLFSEIQKYRVEGRIPDEKLDSNHGRTIFIELMRIIDEETLDQKKFEALKSIFLKSVQRDTDEHSQMLAYQYFQVCKKLSSLDILILKTAFDVYKEPGSNQRTGGIHEWEVSMAETLGIPRELVTQSRIQNSGVSQTANTLVFDNGMDSMSSSRHGLSALGIEVGEFMSEPEVS